MNTACHQRTRKVEGLRASGRDEVDLIGSHLQASTSLSEPEAADRDRKTVFAALVEAVKPDSLEQNSLCFMTWGEYRWNMEG